MLGVQVDARSGTVEIRDEPIYRGVHPQLTQVGGNGVHSSLPYGAEVDQPNLVPYFAMPENYHGNQLKSYGGYLRYNVLHTNRGIQTPGPGVILTGNGYTLLHIPRFSPLPSTSHNMSVRFFEGEWVRRSNNGPENLATREEIMMALANIENILIKLQYNEGILNTTLSSIEMDSAATPNSNLGAASYVEECSCPVGYSGYSCEVIEHRVLSVYGELKFRVIYRDVQVVIRYINQVLGWVNVTRKQAPVRLELILKAENVTFVRVHLHRLPISKKF